MCGGCFSRRAVLAELPFDVPGHPLRSYCRLSLSSCPHNHKGCLLVRHLFMPPWLFPALRFISLFNTCSGRRSPLQSPLAAIDRLAHCHFFFFPHSLIDHVKKNIYSRDIIKVGKITFRSPTPSTCPWTSGTCSLLFRWYSLFSDLGSHQRQTELALLTQSSRGCGWCTLPVKSLRTPSHFMIFLS